MQPYYRYLYPSLVNLIVASSGIIQWIDGAKCGQYNGSRVGNVATGGVRACNNNSHIMIFKGQEWKVLDHQDQCSVPHKATG